MIIILEGVDFLQECNKEGKIFFWLPKYFPERIKILITCQTCSETQEYFASNNCQMIHLEDNPKGIKEIISYSNEFNIEEESFEKMKNITNPFHFEIISEYYLKNRILTDSQIQNHKGFIYLSKL